MYKRQRKDSEGQDSRVNLKVNEIAHVRWHQRDERRKTGEGEAKTKKAAAGHEQKAFDNQLLKYSLTAGAERHAQRHFPLAFQAAREEEVCDVGAGD